jgi:hypothetical protein
MTDAIPNAGRSIISASFPGNMGVESDIWGAIPPYIIYSGIPEKPVYIDRPLLNKIY